MGANKCCYDPAGVTTLISQLTIDSRGLETKKTKQQKGKKVMSIKSNKETSANTKKTNLAQCSAGDKGDPDTSFIPHLAEKNEL